MPATICLDSSISLLILKKIDYGFVSFGDSSKIEAKGKDEICYSRKDDKQGKIKDIYYVPYMEQYS